MVSANYSSLNNSKILSFEFYCTQFLHLEIIYSLRYNISKITGESITVKAQTSNFDFSKNLLIRNRFVAHWIQRIGHNHDLF